MTSLRIVQSANWLTSSWFVDEASGYRSLATDNSESSRQTAQNIAQNASLTPFLQICSVFSGASDDRRSHVCSTGLIWAGLIVPGASTAVALGAQSSTFLRIWEPGLGRKSVYLYGGCCACHSRCTPNAFFTSELCIKFILAPIAPMVGGGAQWLERRSLASGPSLIYAWTMVDMWPLCG